MTDILDALRSQIGDDVQQVYLPEALCKRAAAEIAKLRQALQDIIDDAVLPRRLYDRNGPQWTSPAGQEFYDASYLHDKMDELAAIAQAAIAKTED